jgi:hypothetical protein
VTGPRRRELLLALGVLAPFGALVALGLAAWQPGPAAPLPTPVNPASGGPPREASPRPGDGGGAPGEQRAPGGQRAPGEQRPAGARSRAFALDLDGGDYPPALAAPLRAVAAEVVRCAEDQAGRAPARLAVDVDFQPTPDGRFIRVSVASSWQDPYLTACVEDVFAEVPFTPSGMETFAPAAFRFTLVR